jgi:hypothetical protein
MRRLPHQGARHDTVDHGDASNHVFLLLHLWVLPSNRAILLANDLSPWRGPELGPPSTARLSPLRQQDHYPQGGVSCSLASSLMMVVPLPTTTSRGSPPFTWCSAWVVVCRSSSRPPLERRPVFSQLAPSPTNFPLEEPISASHDKSPPRTTSLRLAREVRLRLVRGPRRKARASPPTRVEERISTSRGNNNWRPCRQPAPARALM